MSSSASRAISAEAAPPGIADLLETRQLSVALAEPLSPEDQTVQASDDASPVKWHLAHTTWFFETFVLAPHAAGYRLYDDRFGYCFNSYYEAEGPRHPRSRRGLLTRPSSAEVLGYRAYVDEALDRFLSASELEPSLAALLAIGVNHEQQHQELLLTDVLALFAANPLRPAYRERSGRTLSRSEERASTWSAFDGGLVSVGAREGTFHWDNEAPRHRVFVAPFRICDRLTTNGEWLEFMRDGGYDAPGLWLSDGWATINREGWRAPLYWEQAKDQWMQMGLAGLELIDPNAPVAHVSFYEADAFARWSGKRLPTEFEWEIAAGRADRSANDLGTDELAPRPAPVGAGLQQMFGDVWEWTQSAYLPYPGYRSPAGAVGEYNGKFMSGQMVLRGASCVTPRGHSRETYRNFFYPHQRWQFMGLRLAEDAA